MRVHKGGIVGGSKAEPPENVESQLFVPGTLSPNIGFDALLDGAFELACAQKGVERAQKL
jgi:hypothetical protein